MKLQWFGFGVFLLILTTLVSTFSIAQKNNKKAVLIVDGFSNHDWKQTTKVTKWILEQSGLFEVSVSTIPSDSLEKAHWLPNFKKYDVVVQNSNNIHNLKLRWPPKAEKSLELYVKKGGGLYILHSGNNAFSHWPEYNKMIGLGWRDKNFGYALEIDSEKKVIAIPPNEGLGTGHGNRFNALIEVLNPHPINKGFPAQWQTANTEVYHFPRGIAQNLTVLSFAYDSTATKRYWPVEWVVKYGKGRVYNSSMGHLWRGEIYPSAYRCVGFQTIMIRATEWLATGKVNFPVPNDFPTKTQISLKKQEDFNNDLIK